MKISYNWLQTYIAEPLPPVAELAEKIIFGAFEVENADNLEKLGNGDVIMDIKVLPDRAHDCLSHYGIAKEVSGLLGLTLKPLEFKTHMSIESDIKVSIETDLCRRYIARKILHVTVGPSPDWLVTRLESIGQRSINNIVDATNYIMYSFGQPIHAFDYDKISEGKIIIRPAFDGEQLTTLDEKLVTLSPSEIVIADSEKALALAGVKGGNAAEVDDTTKNIIIEVANFNPISVRKTAQKLTILTDSAKRFENELTPQLAGTAIHLVTDLITEIAGGQPCFPIDEYPNPVIQRSVTVTTDYVNSVLGTTITIEELSEILERYHYEFAETSGTFTMAIPFERLDIIGAHDMVEEIGRAYGYDRIPAVLPSINFVPKTNEVFAKITAIKNDLVSKGYHEVMNYTFTKKGDFEVARGLVGKSALRTQLSDGLAKSYELNKKNADLIGVSEMKIFEVGTIFLKSGEYIHVAFADKSGITEMSIDDYSIEKDTITYNSTNAPVEKFIPWSEYPFITRDIALWIPSDVSTRDVASLLEQHTTALSVREPRLFDTFTKDNRTSVAFRLVFQSFTRTLENSEVDTIMEKIYTTIKEKDWEVR